VLKKVRRLPSLAWKGLRRAAPVLVGLLVVAGAAYAVKTQLLDEDEAPAARVSVQVLPVGTFAAAHPYAPYYVVPRKRFGSPSDLTRAARNNLVTRPESAIGKGALAGSPQIVRLSLRSESDGPVTVDAVRAKVVSDARPLRGWFTALPGCEFEAVPRARLNLDSQRGSARYLGTGTRSSKTLSLELDRTEPQVLELQAATRSHRAAWVAELTVRNADGDATTITVDDGGEPFRVTSERESRSYQPIYGQSGIIGYSEQKLGFEDC
jgi:hypothetical protein